MSKVDEAIETMKQNLAAKTGRSLEAWVTLVQKQKQQKHGQIVAWLKADHDLSHGYANLIANHALAAAVGTITEDEVLLAQYMGAKAALKPIYDALEKIVAGFGKDIEFAPKKTYVSLRRSKQFALIQPSTATRMDIGINLQGVPVSERLEASGSFNAMVTHRVRIENLKQIDAELKGWLKQAYDAA
jgi:predicted transport protein